MLNGSRVQTIEQNRKLFTKMPHTHTTHVSNGMLKRREIERLREMYGR